MFLLAGEATHLYGRLLKIDSGFFHFLGTQLEHHEWHGLHFWDLIQPFFMFIVGVAIPFAVANRLKKGDSIRKINQHALSVHFCFCSLAGHYILLKPIISFSGFRMSLHNCQLPIL